MTVSTKHSQNFGEENNPREIPARRGFSVSYLGKTLLSRIDPVAQAERLAAELSLNERTLYFCPSPLYGYGLSPLLERIKNEAKGSCILCAEADEKLYELSAKSMSEITAGKNIALVKTPEPESLCAFVRETWGERIFRRVELVRLSGGWQLFPELYNAMEAALRREIALEWGNALTLIRLGRLYSKNLIRNLALAGGFDTRTPHFGNAPLLVLGAGPSLDLLLDELSALWGGKIPAQKQRRFKIICVDSCLAALAERGIIPDLVVILESQHWNLRDFTGLNGMEIDAALDLSSLPASARVLAGKSFLFATEWTRLALFKRLEKAGLLPETFPPLGSVGLNAVAFALRSGSGPVITGGIDFSYTLDAYHARSTPGYRDLEKKQNRFKSLIAPGAAFRDGTFPAVSKNGKRVRSDPAMRNYRALFSEEFGKESRLLDIEGSGLPLGIKTIPAKDAFAILNGAGPGDRIPPATQKATRQDGEKSVPGLIEFIRAEMETLKTLQDMLSGAIPPEPARLEELLDTADYLWAHFPECAGAGGQRPSAADLSFLKRVRTEIEPFRKLWEISLKEIHTC